MKKILSDSSVWFTLLAILTFLIFLLRGLKTLRWKIFARIFISLSCISAALVLFPRPVPVKLLRFFASAIVIVAAGAILADFFLAFILRVKRAVLSGRDFTTPLPDYLMEICRAMEVLASRRIGALIVLKRNDALEGYIDNGIIYDAQIQAEILIALFSKTSPVHDGAVIVTNSRIRKVKAIIPIRTDSELPMGIGTRHRSAVAITEKTDAIALAVSEERGEISIAYQGYLIKVESPEELYRLIKTALKGKSIAPIDA